MILDIVIGIWGAFCLLDYSYREYSREKVWAMIFSVGQKIEEINKKSHLITKPEKKSILENSNRDFQHLEREFADNQFVFKKIDKYKKVLKKLSVINQNLENLNIPIHRIVR